MTSDYKSARRSVAEFLKANSIRSIVYFHTDHFEPNRSMADRDVFSNKNLEDIQRFSEAISQIDYARRLTLFWNPPFWLAERRGDLHMVEGDGVGFAQLDERQHTAICAGMRVMQKTGANIQIHLHHEYFTHNDLYAVDPRYQKVEGIRRFLAERSTPRLDAERFGLLIDLTLDLYRSATAMPFDRWFFIHGMWALNASDPDVCQIDTEIEILLDKGCLGDFTFPAGRAHTNPKRRSPFLCRPVAAPKGYDTAAADPIEAAAGIAQSDAAARFFVWASSAAHRTCSIDYYGTEFAAAALDIPRWATSIVNDSVRVGDTLFIKTHAHSMHPQYFRDVEKPLAPHQHPAVRALLGSIFDGATDVGVAVRFLTAPQVYDVFTSGRAADGNHAQVFGSSLEDGLNRAEQDSLLGLAEHQAGAAMNGLRGPASADQIQRQEAPLAEAIAGTVWPGQRIVVASARFSTVAVALAARGLNVVEAIFDAARAAVAKAAVDAINRESARGRPQFEVEFTATGGLAEFAWRRYASTVVFADCSMGLGDEEVAQLLATLARVPLIVLDPDRFFRRRVAADRPALARMITSAGLAEPDVLIDVADRQYWAIRSFPKSLPKC